MAATNKVSEVTVEFHGHRPYYKLPVFRLSNGVNSVTDPMLKALETGILIRKASDVERGAQKALGKKTNTRRPNDKPFFIQTKNGQSRLIVASNGILKMLHISGLMPDGHIAIMQG